MILIAVETEGTFEPPRNSSHINNEIEPAAAVYYLVALYIVYFFISIVVEGAYYFIRRKKLNVSPKNIFLGSLMANTVSYIALALVFIILMHG
jgi:hypothetical protein